MMLINNNYELGDIVYLKTDGTSSRWIVTKIMVSANGALLYELSCAAKVYVSYEIEMTLNEFEKQ